MVKYAFGFPVVAMVSCIPVKSRIPGNDVIAFGAASIPSAYP